MQREIRPMPPALPVQTARQDSRPSTSSAPVVVEMEPTKFKDRSLLLCLSSLILFTLFIGVILLSLYLGGYGPDSKRTDCSGEKDAYGVTGAQTGLRMAAGREGLPGSIGTGSFNATVAAADKAEEDGRGSFDGEPAEPPVVNDPEGDVPAPTRGNGRVEASPSPSSKVTGRSGGITSFLADDDDEDEEPPLEGQNRIPLPDDPVCKHDACNSCKKEFARITMYRKFGVDPCTDFYDYACGGLEGDPFLLQPDPHTAFLAKLSTARESLDAANSSEPQRVWKQFLDSCLSHVPTDRVVSNLRAMFERKGQLRSEADWHPNIFSVTKSVAFLLLMDIAPLFEVGVEPAFQDGQISFVLTIRPPRRSKLWPDDSAHLPVSELQQATWVEKYVEETKRGISVLQTRPVDNDTLSETLDDVRSYVRVLLNSQRVKDWENVRVEELQDIFPAVSWTQFFPLLNCNEVFPDTVLRLYDKAYFEALDSRIRLRTRQAHNHLMSIFAHELTIRFLDEMETPTSRKNFCLRLTSNVIKDISAAVYLQTFTHQHVDNASKQIARVYNESKFQLGEQVDLSNCLDDSSRNLLKEKVLYGTVLVSELEQAKNLTWEVLSSRLSNLSPGQGFIDDSIMWLRRESENVFCLWGKEVKRGDLQWLPPTRAVTFVHEMTALVVPLHYLGLAMDPAVPNHVIQARLGFAMSRALSSVLDYTGISYDVSGSYRPDSILPDEALASVYRNLHNHYNNSQNMPRSQEVINARLGDDLAVRSAYSAAFSDEHLASEAVREQFFLSLVQQECLKDPEVRETRLKFGEDPMPRPLRMDLMLSMFSEFSRTFSCRRFDGDEAPVLCMGEN